MQVLGTYLNIIDPLDLGYSPKGGAYWGLGGNIVPTKDQDWGTGEHSKDRKSIKPGEPTPPSADSAGAAAEDKMTESRRALLTSGGETSLTGPGGAPILGGMTSSKTLLGV
jgi:hypothetical protein